MTSKPTFLLALGAALLLGACGKKPAPPKEEALAAVAQPATTMAATAEPSADDRENAARKAQLDYATMEDGYLNDAHGQWASSAKASSSYEEDAAHEPPKTPQDSLAWKATGKPDESVWRNHEPNLGFDWLQLSYDKPVSATEVRMVGDYHAAESFTKLELLDTEGATHLVWSGLSEVRRDDRGPRTWVARKLDMPTPYKVRGVKITFANNVSTGHKEVDAVQLIGD